MLHLQCLESAELKPGDRVLVHAGAGGVGAIAVQLAKAYWGAYVVATAGPSNQSFLTEVRRHSVLAPQVILASQGPDEAALRFCSWCLCAARAAGLPSCALLCISAPRCSVWWALCLAFCLGNFGCRGC